MGLVLFGALLLAGDRRCRRDARHLLLDQQRPSASVRPREDRAARAVRGLRPDREDRAGPIRRVQPRGRHVRRDPARAGRRHDRRRGRVVLGQRGLRHDRDRGGGHRLAHAAVRAAPRRSPSSSSGSGCCPRTAPRRPSCPRPASCARSSSRSASPRPTRASRASSGSWPPTSTRTTTATSRTASPRPRKSYFGKELKDLTLAQAAILAALPKSPSTYDLVQNADVVCLDPGADQSEADACKDSQLVVPSRRRDRPAAQPGPRPDGAGPHAAHRQHATRPPTSTPRVPSRSCWPPSSRASGRPRSSCGRCARS